MRNRLGKAVAFSMAAILALGAMTESSPLAQAASKKVKITKSVKVTVGKKAKITLKNNSKKVKWKVVKGKKNIKITKKTKKYAVIKGVKTGSASIKAVIGKKKYTCKITVSAKKGSNTANNNAANTAGSASVTPTKPAGGNQGTDNQSADAAKLREIITQQKALGAEVDEDLNSYDYGWNEEGRLTNLSWCGIDLQGSIDFSSFTALKYLDCSDNRLNNISVAGCTVLETLDCRNNPLNTLDVRGCLELWEFSYDSDVVVTGWQENGKQEADVTALQEIIASQKELGAQVSEDLDSNQYQWNGGGRLASIHWYQMELQGDIDFSAFTGLKDLECADNSLTGLNVKGCSKLQDLNCSSNRIGSLDVSGCTALEQLVCSYNDLESLDVSGCPALDYLNCGDNQLDSLDISDCRILKSLYCSNNMLASLDVSSCPALQELNCSNNNIALLDVSACLQLDELNCDDDTEVIRS